MKNIPYIDFYRKHIVSPVSQDISDIEKHFERRNSLYRHLGIIPLFLSGKNVIEFGPGCGYNSIYTNSLGPALYVLVDGNPTGVNNTKNILAQYATSSTSNYKVVESMIEEYQDSMTYDFVFCECLIPRQNDPTQFLKNISKFVKPGGILVITCVCSISWFSEALRRIMSYLIIDEADLIEQNLKKLRPFLEPQLKYLTHMSRPIDDWIIDNILNPFNNSLLSIADAIEALDEQFDIYGSSPHFCSDWRWYKELHGNYRKFNILAKETFYSNAHNLMDHRFLFPKRSVERNKYLIDLCNQIVKTRTEIEQNRNLDKLFYILPKISEEIKTFSNEISDSINDYIQAIKYYKEYNKIPSLNGFMQFWGRGVQYLSFIKTK